MRYFHCWSFLVIFFSDATIKNTTKRKITLFNSFPKSCFLLTETTLELIRLAQHFLFSFQPKTMIALRMKQVYMIETWCSMNEWFFVWSTHLKNGKPKNFFIIAILQFMKFFVILFWYVDQRKKISNKKIL